jgi:hypothetical protein
MPFLSEPDTLQIVGCKVAYALAEAFKNPSQSEPQLVANFVFEFVKTFNSVKLPEAMKITAGGVFVHARPLVSCQSFPKTEPSSVEIGDLLLIRTLVVNGQVSERRALLLQAKKANSIPAVPDNKNQWHLYEQWPRFSYAARSGRLKGRVRHVKEPDMYEAAKYLLIGQGSAACLCYCPLGDPWPFCSSHQWRMSCVHHSAQPTTPAISRYRCFSGELIAFLAGDAGKVFSTPKPRSRGWDRVIQDLIEQTAKAKSIFCGRAAGTSTSAVRGSGVLFLSLVENSAFSVLGSKDDGQTISPDRPPNVPAEWNGDDDGGGISLVEFIVERGKD